jgi:hypothetical protein
VDEDRSAVAEPQAPLNLSVRRGAQTKARRVASIEPLQLLGLIVPAALLLSAFGRRNRFSVPAAAALAAGTITAVVTAVLSNRRRCAREAAIDDRIEQSFPASDPASV